MSACEINTPKYKLSLFNNVIMNLDKIDNNVVSAVLN